MNGGGHGIEEGFTIVATWLLDWWWSNPHYIDGGTKILAIFLMDSSTTFWPCHEKGPKVVRTWSLETSTY